MNFQTLAQKSLAIAMAGAVVLPLGTSFELCAQDEPAPKTAQQPRETPNTEDDSASTADEPKSAPARPRTAVRENSQISRQPAAEPRARVRVEEPIVTQPAIRGPAAVRVETARPVVGAPATSVVADARTTRRAFRVVDIRPPDVGIWFDPAATDSLVIADIAPIGPIAQLGFEEGDRILEVNHVKVTRETDFIKLLFATKAREGRVEVLIVRKNKEMVIPVEPALLIEHYTVVRHDPLEQLGLVIDDRYDDRVVVWKVIPGTPAFYGGLRAGDVITRFGDQRIVQRKAFGEVIQTIQPGIVAVEVDRAKRVRPIRIEVPRDWNSSQAVSTDIPAEPGAAVEIETRPAPARAVEPPRPPVPPRDERPTPPEEPRGR